MRKKDQKGFAALLPVIIISSILLIVAISSNTAIWSIRSSVLDRELKKQSSLLAEACLEEARFLLARDDTYTGTGELEFESGTCDFEVFPGWSIRSEAESNRTYTYLWATVNANMPKVPIENFRECVTYDSCP